MSWVVKLLWSVHTTLLKIGVWSDNSLIVRYKIQKPSRKFQNYYERLKAIEMGKSNEIGINLTNFEWYLKSF